MPKISSSRTDRVPCSGRDGGAGCSAGCTAAAGSSQLRCRGSRTQPLASAAVPTAADPPTGPRPEEHRAAPTAWYDQCPAGGERLGITEIGNVAGCSGEDHGPAPRHHAAEEGLWQQAAAAANGAILLQSLQQRQACRLDGATDDLVMCSGRHACVPDTGGVDPPPARSL
ncbi:hypothetical protein PLESTB_001375900 [Pleodorina starrii]|uniref:Uncharacterized protein n=1 Tax=Pleodorina starrii TaxID=330485 RepID=A0A9W6F6X0_9CHLO|nr:hypothetical protein PLESTM_000409000 [Pleodorina starrii]GLC58573.1 hypothetical protein PLESTB_001375900 [Pleodorina starrii]